MHCMALLVVFDGCAAGRVGLHAAQLCAAVSFNLRTAAVCCAGRVCMDGLARVLTSVAQRGATVVVCHKTLSLLQLGIHAYKLPADSRPFVAQGSFRVCRIQRPPIPLHTHVLPHMVLQPVLPFAVVPACCWTLGVLSSLGCVWISDCPPTHSLVFRGTHTSACGHGLPVWWQFCSMSGTKGACRASNARSRHVGRMEVCYCSC